MSENFLRLGQRCYAKVTIYDLPGNANPGPIHAEPGELGTVVHVEPGFWPTVTFDRTGTSTCVTDQEVEAVSRPDMRTRRFRVFRICKPHWHWRHM